MADTSSQDGAGGLGRTSANAGYRQGTYIETVTGRENYSPATLAAESAGDVLITTCG